MILIALFLIPSLAICAEYSVQYDTFANFAKQSNRTYTSSTSFDCITDIYITGENVIFKGGVSPHVFVKLNNLGEEIAILNPGLAFENRFEGHPVSWEQSSFIAVGGNVIKKYDYNFNLVTSFGNNGIAELNIAGTAIQFTTIIKHGNYYYIGGYTLGSTFNDWHTVVARFTLEGILDTNFNSSDTAGYKIFTTTAWWGPHQMLIVDNHIIIRTSNNALISVSLQDESNVTLVNAIGLAETCSIAPDSTGKSFYAYQVDLSNSWIPTLFKYTTSLELDISLNDTGKYIIDFASINSELATNTIWTLKTINNQLFLVGGYPSNQMQGPFILCFSMKNRVPVLDSSFLGRGYLRGDQSDYPIRGGTFDMAFSNTTLPSVFFSCGKHITKVPLGEEFIIANNLIPPIITARLAFYESQGKTIPLLAGMFQ